MKSIFINLLLLITFFLPVNTNCFAQSDDCRLCPSTTHKPGNYSSINKTANKNESSSDIDKNNFSISESQNNSDSTDEFLEYSESENLVDIKYQETVQNKQLIPVIVALIGVILSGFLVRMKQTRNLRFVVMIGFLIYLGFYLGGCPCPMSGFQNVVLAALGSEVHWQGLIWFLALIPITYIFGKVWCGWVCHLGSLQELLYFHKNFNILKSKKAQTTLMNIRYILMAALIIQLLITRTNLFCKIDPFKAAFNFIMVFDIGWYFLGLLILSSIFIYRPFCKAACPIGFVLGLASRIPGALVIGFGKDCNNCSHCLEHCKMDAIRKDTNDINKSKYFDCNHCGDCIDICDKNNISFIRFKGSSKNCHFHESGNP